MHPLLIDAIVKIVSLYYFITDMTGSSLNPHDQVKRIGYKSELSVNRYPLNYDALASLSSSASFR